MFVEKHQFLSQKNQQLNNIIYSQFIAALNGIICSSVCFCDNSLLMLKICFQDFSFARKKVQGFSTDKKILMLFLSVLFHLLNHASVF